jgi:hypothetical protein
MMDQYKYTNGQAKTTMFGSVNLNLFLLAEGKSHYCTGRLHLSLGPQEWEVRIVS